MQIPLIDPKRFVNKIESTIEHLEQNSALQLFTSLNDGTGKNRVQMIKKYQPYQVPPDWEVAEDHRLAMRIAKPELPGPGEPIDVDEMSGRPINNKPIRLGCDRRELDFLGPSFPLYFQFYGFTFRILFVFLFLYGIFAIYSNSEGNYCNNVPTLGNMLSPDICFNYTVLKHSLANRINEDNTGLLLQKALALGAFIVIIIMLQKFRYEQRKEAQECDNREWTAADFTFEVRNLPPPKSKDSRVKEEIAEWFRLNARPGKITSVARVNLAYDVTEIVKIEKKIENLIKKRRTILAANPDFTGNNKEISEIEDQIKELEESLRKLEKEFSKGRGENYLRIAFVTLNSYEECLEVRNNFKEKRLISRLFNSSSTLSQKFYWNGHQVRLRQADEPSDVLWENIAVPNKIKIRNRIIGNLISFSILLVCFFLIFEINHNKKQYVDKQKSRSQTTPLTSQEKWVIRIIGWIATVIVLVINTVLRNVLKKLCLFEKYNSWTEYYIALATKQTWAQFLNSGGILLLMSLIVHNFWGHDGLIMAIHQVFVFSALLSPLMGLLNIPYHIKAYRRYREKKKAFSTMTQKEANLFFEDSACDFAEKYSTLLKNLFMAALYAPILPVAIFWTIIGNFFLFYVEKYNILRRNSICRSLGPSLAREMTEFLEWFLIIYGISAFGFNYLFLGEVSIFDIALFVLAIVNAFLPMDEINKIIYGPVAPQNAEETYENMRLYLEEDYDRCNPATSGMAIEKYSDEVQSVGQKKKYHNRFMHKFFLIPGRKERQLSRNAGQPLEIVS